MGLTTSGKDSSSGRATDRPKWRQRDRELTDRLQGERERASPTTHATPVNQGVTAAMGTQVIPTTASGAMPPHAFPIRTKGRGQGLTQEEQAAVALLAKNIVDFDRSLEPVRGLPESLVGAAPEAQRYFRTFAAAFERAYGAAQALASGAVKVQLSGMKDQMLEGVLKAVGCVAGASNVPFLGIISIVASVIMYPSEMRQVNLLSVFQDFFSGDSRDQYLITYRRLAEVICLRIDFTSYASDVHGKLKEDNQCLKTLIQKVRKRLQCAHFLQLTNLDLLTSRQLLT
uniref:Uncharacterized protein n=1 Tax=Pseudictyota dubia TaxID=2749911 RepID=A0A7R9YXY3_9STRA